MNLVLSDDVLLTVNGSDHNATITISGDAPTQGDLVKSTISPSGRELSTILARTEVRFVALNAEATIKVAQISDASITTTALTSSQTALLVEQLLNNAIVTRNNLTMWDVTRTLSALQALLTADSGDVSAGAAVVLNLFAVNVIDQFNTGNYVDGSSNPCTTGKIQLNGHDRFQVLDGHYFNYVQPWQHFSNTPQDGVNVYSFALKAEDHQPTGTCNFSRIDNATLLTTFGVENWLTLVNNNTAFAGPTGGATYSDNYLGSNSLLNIYTVNYNVLRVMSGMAGTAYSN